MEQEADGMGGLAEDVTEGLRGLLESKELSDLTLFGFADARGAERDADSSQRILRVHRVVLALRSPLLRTLLSSGGQFGSHSEVDVREFTGRSGVEMEVMRAVVHFMYTDELVHLQHGNLALAAKIHKAARLFEVGLLARKVAEWLVAALREMREEKAELAWLQAVLQVLDFALQGRNITDLSRGNLLMRYDDAHDKDLAIKCVEMIKTAVYENDPSMTVRAALLRAIHSKMHSLIEPIWTHCDATVAADLILDITDQNEAETMEFAVLIGRSDVLMELISRGVHPDTPTSLSGLLPVEIALQLSKEQPPAEDGSSQASRLRHVRVSVSSPDRYAPASPVSKNAISSEKNSERISKILRKDLRHAVDWLTQEDMTEIVETLILGSGNTLDQDDHSMLNLASRLGNARHVEALLNSGADVNESDPANGRGPLHCAAEGGHGDVIKVLLDHGVVPNQQDFNGCTALHHACRSGHASVVELLQGVVNEKIPDRFGWTALHHAARKGHPDIVQRILEKSPDPLPLILATEYDQGSTAMHIAAANSHYKVVLLILECARELDAHESSTSNCIKVANAKDLFSRTALHRACAASCDSLVSAEFANFNEMDPEVIAGSEEIEAFRQACKVLDALVDAESDVMSKTKLNYVPLHFALGGERSHAIGLSGKRSPTRKEYIQVQSSYAALRQQTEMGPAEVSRFQNTAKMLSILLGVQGGHAAVRVVGSDGVTPLHCAVRYGHIRGVSMLLDFGADVNARDHFEDTPLALAREHWPLGLFANIVLRQLKTQPRWVADTEVTHCESCKSEFSMTNRKHHCRHCCAIHCSACTMRKVPIPKFVIKGEVRVCDACFEALTWHDEPDALIDDGFDEAAYGESSLEKHFEGGSSHVLEDEVDEEVAAPSPKESLNPFDDKSDEVGNRHEHAEVQRIRINSKTKRRRQVEL